MVFCQLIIYILGILFSTYKNSQMKLKHLLGSVLAFLGFSLAILLLSIGFGTILTYFLSIFISPKN